MAKIACIFPGQGSQFVGMGKDLFEASAVAREAFEIANEVLGYDLVKICFEGPEETLRETRYTQPAILAHSVAVWRMLEGGGVLPAFVAGHSVGEYSALVASGVLGYTDALRLVRVRAEAMYSSGVETPGSMAAIIGMPEEALEGLLREARDVGIIEPANYNSPVQIAVSGQTDAVMKAIEVARSHGAKRAIRLNVSGAFHSPLMRVAEAELASALERINFEDATIPVVANVTGTAVTAGKELAGLLKKQLTMPVLWSQSMVYLRARGVDTFVEVGPGKVLCGLMKRIDSAAWCKPCSDIEAIQDFLKEVIP
jgi:[acyl-carrier-protein] S-malonyltransferase